MKGARLTGLLLVAMVVAALGPALPGGWAATKRAPRTAQAPDQLLRILRSGSREFRSTLKHSSAREIQIIYTQIDRDREGKPKLNTFRYRASPRRFYYPASLVKLPLAALALEKIKRLGLPGVTRDTRMRIEAAGSCQPLADTDPTSSTGFPSLAHYIRKVFVVSDGDAYNRLYEFLGPDQINERLREMGYSSSYIVHRFADCSFRDNELTGPVVFLDGAGAQIYRQAAEVATRYYSHPLGFVKRGRAQIIRGRRVRRPKDFSGLNFISLEDMHEMLIALTLPEAAPESRRFDLDEQDRAFLLDSMQMYPRESDWPAYPESEYPDGYVKYLIFGPSRERIDPAIRIYNKVGQSYGYLSDCAYIVNRERGIEFFLSAVIYSDRDGVMNDGKYDYEKVGLPFLGELGRLVYRYEEDRNIKSNGATR